MARPKKTSITPKTKKRSKALVHFTALQIEGGILSPAVLSKVAQFGAGMQSETDYQIPKGLTLRDEIGRYWRMASAQWGAYKLSGRSHEFVKNMLREVFQFKLTEQGSPFLISERAFPITATLNGGAVPLVIAESVEGLDTLQPKFGDSGKKRTAFGLLQEFLNAEDSCLWGIASDGNTIRIARDNSSLTRPAWIEADLRRIFEEELYADFAVLWLVMHSSSFSEKSPAESRIEKWREQGREEGARASEKLRLGVEEALKILGDGFIKHQKNQELRQKVLSGGLTAHQYYQELLRLVYRMIFLLTVEERERLHPKGTLKNSKDLYAEGYSMGRIRARAIRRTAYDRYGDLWDGLKITFKGLAQGETRLGLPALGGLFGDDQTPSLGQVSIENRFLLSAVRCLSWLEEDDGLSKVNWRDMGPEELGSVYESLLELVPQFYDSGNGFKFASVEDSKGNQRKTSGSYYTPDSLVQSLLDSALEPVIEDTIRKNPEGADRALLKLSIIDPACGSGHFLLGAARRLAVHVARIRAQGTPTAEEFEKALRQVISKCIYGVDRNPMALELARTALWLEAVSPDAPLSFLDHHLVCGDGLLGLIDLGVLKDGIPQEAFKALEGDEPRVVKALAEQNKEKLKGIKTGRDADLFSQSFDNFKPAVIEEWTQIQEMPDDTLEAVEKKKKAFQKYQQTAWSVTSDPIGLAADMYVSAFMARKTDQVAMKIPTSAHLGRVLSGAKIDEGMIQFVREQARRHRFLHWKLKFPDVFKKGGFDCVLGNPPWEKVNFKDEEYFSSSHPEIANAPNKAKRKALMESLQRESPAVYEGFQVAKHTQDAQSDFFRFSRRFPWTGVSRINLYSVFCETAVQVLGKSGRLGLVIASGIATDENNKELLNTLFNDRRLIHVWDFENREGIFPEVDSRFKFCLFCAGGEMVTVSHADFVFYLTNQNQLSEEKRHFSLTKDELRLLNPNSKTCPTFRNSAEAEITKFIYMQNPVWELQEKSDDWPGVPKTPFNMSNDSGLFHDAASTETDLVPVYESKYMHQFNHRFATFSDDDLEGARELESSQLEDTDFMVRARYWLMREKLNERFPGRWHLAYRMITRATDERTSIATILPEVACGNSLSIIQSVSARKAAVMCSVLNSFVYDYCTRQKLNGTNFNHWIWHQLPLPAKQILEGPAPWDRKKTIQDWISERVLELTYTAKDLAPFAMDLGVESPPHIWDSDRRLYLRAELDAAMFHIFLPVGSVGDWGGSNGRGEQVALKAAFPCPRDAIEYILETFPIVKSRDIQEFGSFRTKQLILEIYDKMFQLIRTGGAYEGNSPPKKGHQF